MRRLILYGTLAAVLFMVPASYAGINQVSLAWTAPTVDATHGAATNYDVQRAPGTCAAPGSFTDLGSTGSTATTFVDTVTPGQYCYRVRALNANGYGPFSNLADGTSVAPAPGAPTNLQAS